jgi:hypothetical protein
MTSARTPPPVAGILLHRLATRLLDSETVRSVVEPTIADLQHEARSASAGGWRRPLVLFRNYAACVKVILVSLISRRMLMPI